ncbi:hypothetical protein BS47DRAFT_1264189, partial [Hydnum rufescens UP504]
RAVCLNWLCNPTGHPDGFHVIDWVVEIDNLYIKRTYTGHGPNRTIKHIIEQSLLINIYHTFGEIIEDNYDITQRMVWHARPLMGDDLNAMGATLRKRQVHTFIQGCKAVPVQNHIVEGIKIL